MGAIHLRRVALVTSLNEVVGYKAGVALTQKNMEDMLPDDRLELFQGNPHDFLRVRSEMFDELLAKLLYGVGNIASPTVMPRRLQIYHQVKGDARLHAVYQKVLELFVTWLTEEMKEVEQSGKKSLDPTKFLERTNQECGLDGSAMALEFLIGHQEDSHKGFFNHFRQFDWQNVTDLSELFKSESLATPHGEFLDQRFVDYLAQNFSSLGSINWRKFEALTCEFFHRIGFHVEIGEGRNDEGVDARIWSDEAEHSSAPLILVQCKRQKAKVGKTVVKALYADVQAENAKLGLIVTSSALEPGAREMCTARSYPVAESNRKNLKKWIEAMRTPRAGLFFGE